MFKSCKNVSNLAFFVHAKSSLLFGLCDMVKRAKITVYFCGLFLDSILSKREGFSICRSNFSQGSYSNIIHTLALHKKSLYKSLRDFAYTKNKILNEQMLRKCQQLLYLKVSL